jgi:hypothetical protein
MAAGRIAISTVSRCTSIRSTKRWRTARFVDGGSPAQRSARFAARSAILFRLFTSGAKESIAPKTAAWSRRSPVRPVRDQCLDVAGGDAAP